MRYLGYVDPAGALRHIDALTSGVSRRAAIQRTLLPVLLGWFADAAEPDAGLLAFRQVSEALGSSPWYLRLLRDETKAAERMARVLASSRYAAGLLLRAPEAVAIFANDTDGGQYLWLLAFLAGVVPTTVLQRIARRLLESATAAARMTTLESQNQKSRTITPPSDPYVLL